MPDQTPARTDERSTGSTKARRHRSTGPTQDKTIGTCPGCGQDVVATMTFKVAVGAIDVETMEATTDVKLVGVKIPAHSCDGSTAASSSTSAGAPAASSTTGGSAATSS